MPLVAAHLVEAQDLHALDVLQRRNEVGQLFDVVVAVGQAGDEDEADPRRTPQCGEPLREFERRLERMAADFLKGRRIAALDVENLEIDVLQFLVGEPVAQPPRGLHRGVEPERLAAPENLRDERLLHHRVAARDRDAAAHLENVGVLADLAHRARDRDRMAVVLVPGIRVVAELAAQRAAREKRDEADARPVHRGADFVRVHEADDVLLAGFLLVARIDRQVIVHRLALGRAFARDVQLVAAADQRLVHGAPLHRAVEGAVHHVELLLLRELDEVHRVAGHAHRELRILLRVLHRVRAASRGSAR